MRAFALVAYLLLTSGFCRGEVVEYSQQGCPPCQRMRPVVSHLQQQGNPIRVVEDTSQFAHFQIRATPTFVAYEGEREVTRIEGAVSRQQLVALVLQSSDVGRRVHGAVVRITNSLREMSNLGSGTLIARSEKAGVIITCHHLFGEGVGRVVARFSSGKTYQCRIIADDPQADLTLLLIARPESAPVPVAIGIDAKDTFWGCGYGGNGLYRCAVGKYVSRAVSQGQESLVISDYVRSGDSGGGMFDSQGRLVAVVWGSTGQETYASYGPQLYRLLDKAAVHYTQCHGGRCRRPPPRVGPPIVAPPRRPPQAYPAQPSEAVGALRQEVESLKQLVANISVTPGPPGPPGPAGPPGPPGPPGTPCTECTPDTKTEPPAAEGRVGPQVRYFDIVPRKRS